MNPTRPAMLVCRACGSEVRIRGLMLEGCQHGVHLLVPVGAEDAYNSFLQAHLRPAAFTFRAFGERLELIKTNIVQK